MRQGRLEPAPFSRLSPDLFASASTDAEGFFEVRDAPTGAYLIEASDPDGACAADGAFVDANWRQWDPLEIFVGPPRTIEGRVTTADGVGIEGTVLCASALHLDSTWPGNPVFDQAGRKAVTGRDGRFRLERIPQGWQALRFDDRQRTLEIRYSPETFLPDGAVLQCPPPTWTRGRVLDAESRRPIPDAEVVLTAAGELTISVRTRTDAMGRFAVVAYDHPGDLEGRARAPGYATGVLHPSWGREGNEGSLDFLLPRLGRVTGRVETREGSPAAGVRVHSIDLGRPEDESPPSSDDAAESAISGRDGEFVLSVAPSPRIVVCAEAEGWVTRGLPRTRADSKEGEGPTVSVEPGGTARTTVVVDHGVSLRGRVVDEADAPLSGASVRVLSADDWSGTSIPFGSRIPWATTDSDGRFELAGVRDGLAYLLVVQGEGRTWQEKKVDVPEADSGPSSDTRIDAARDHEPWGGAEGTPSTMIHGRVVLDDGTGFPYARVLVGIGWRDADQYGRFSIERESEGGSHDVGYADDWRQGENIRVMTTFDVGPKTEDGFLVRVAPGALLAAHIVVLRVRSPDGRAAAWGSASRLTGGSVLAHSGAEGVCALLSYSKEPFGRIAVSGSNRVEGHDVSLAPAILDVPADATVLDVRLEGDHPVVGRVIDDSGEPVGGVALRLSSTNEEEAQHDEAMGLLAHRTTTDRTGAFRIEAVPHGEWALRVDAAPDERVAEPLRVREGATGVVVRLKPALEAAITVLDAEGVPVPGASVTVWTPDRGHAVANAYTDRRGRVSIPHLDPASRFVLQVDGPYGPTLLEAAARELAALTVHCK